MTTQATTDSNGQQLPISEIKEIAASLALVRSETGWGSVTITLKNGKIDEIAVTVTRKPRPQA